MISFKYQNLNKVEIKLTHSLNSYIYYYLRAASKYIFSKLFSTERTRVLVNPSARTMFASWVKGHYKLRV